MTKFISLHYKIITKLWESPSNTYQCDNFSSLIKNKIDNYAYIKLYPNQSMDFSEDIFFSDGYCYKWDLKEAISKNSCTPCNTINNIYFYEKIYVDENKNYTPAFPFGEKRYLYDGEQTIYYAYVDLSKDTVFKNINDAQLNSDWEKKWKDDEIRNLNSTINNLDRNNFQNQIKINQMSRKNQELEKKYNDLQSSHKNEIKNLNNKNNDLKRRFEEEKNQMDRQTRKLQNDIRTLENHKRNIEIKYENLQTENINNKSQLDNLTVQHNYLKKKQEEEEQKKIEKMKNLENYRNKFEKDKEEIENKNIKESKIFIKFFLINEFIKGFEKNINNKDNFTQSLSKYMSKFTKEYMTYCQTFIKSFKNHSEAIINNYKVNENTLSINHINFIVIGSAGVGKSSFINESLLSQGNKRAKEGKGTSVTKESSLYTSDKLTMIRMWDTPGLDNKIRQADILKEITRLVEDGLKKGPDHYINIILYCNKGDRFQVEDAEMIREIMKLYPMDNLPVIITQLQAYFQDDANEMEVVIREILQNYLEYKIVKKIEIASIIARDKKTKNIIYKARGIPELLRSSFDVMGRAITSATCKKYSQDIENLCKNFVDNKIEYLKQRSRDEIEVLEISKDYYMDDSEKYFNNG